MFPTTSILYKRLEDVAKERYQKINKLEKIDSIIYRQNEDNEILNENEMINEIENNKYWIMKLRIIINQIKKKYSKLKLFKYLILYNNNFNKNYITII